MGAGKVLRIFVSSFFDNIRSLRKSMLEYIDDEDAVTTLLSTTDAVCDEFADIMVDDVLKYIIDLTGIETEIHKLCESHDKDRVSDLVLKHIKIYFKINKKNVHGMMMPIIENVYTAKALKPIARNVENLTDKVVDHGDFIVEQLSIMTVVNRIRHHVSS